ncbi:hypothetical protein ACQJBY_044618 [Aegilops geniculata]
MDVGRSGHGVVCSGRRRRWPGGGGGSGWRRPRGQGAGDVAAQGPVHLGCHGVFASLDMFTLMASLSGLWPPACPVTAGASRRRRGRRRTLATLPALEKSRTVKNMGVQGHILYS